jgi:hypothetical protein
MMVSCRNGIVAAVALIGLIPFLVSSDAKAGDWLDTDYCYWYLQKAKNTGEKYWWDRWRRCLHGDDWDTPRRNFAAPRR